VIAADKNHLQRGVSLAPRFERPKRLQRSTLARVQKIAEKYDARRIGARNGRVETIECAASRSTRHRNAGGAKGSRFAEVRIGHEQRPSSLPEGRALGQQV
jgi:hypothetical protein